MSDTQDIRVLIVEDEYMVSKVIENTLQDLNYTIAGKAYNGQKAIEMTEHLQPDVILMDINLPDIDGLAATQQIYQIRPTPVVVLTAYDSQELVGHASEVGVGAYLTKPLQARQVERAITIAMARFDDMVALQKANAELAARNAELDTFSYTVAHQLKNAASLTITFGNFLDEQSNLDEDLQVYLDGIVRSGYKMDRIIRELLLLANMDKADIKPEPLDMAQIISNVKQDLEFEIEYNEAEVIIPTQWPVALGYAPWVEQAWMNYIGNAIKHGGKPPWVEIGSTVQENDMIRFWVRDNGAGLNEAEQAQLFQPFTRLKQATVRGEGLGLAIVRHIVEKLNGTVAVDSEGIPGQGSTFSFTLPASKNEPIE